MAFWLCFRQIPAPQTQACGCRIGEGGTAGRFRLRRKKRSRLAGICLLVAAIFGIGMLAARPAVHPVLVEHYVPWSSFWWNAGAMAVQDGGRLKPVSTYAGFHLLRTLGKRSLVIDTPEGKRKLSPVEWMLDSMFRPELAEQYPVFLVNREEVVRRLHLPPERQAEKILYAQLAERWEEMTRAVREIRLLGETNLTEAQKEILSLARNFLTWCGVGCLVPESCWKTSPPWNGWNSPRWFPAVGRDGERLWTAAPDKAAGAFFGNGVPAGTQGSWHGRGGGFPHCG